MMSWNNLPDDVWEGDPEAPWNQEDNEELLAWQKVNQPVEYLNAMIEGEVDIDIFWLHDLGYSISDVCSSDDERLQEYISECKKTDKASWKELKKDIEWN